MVSADFGLQAPGEREGGGGGGGGCYIRPIFSSHNICTLQAQTDDPELPHQ